MLHLATPEDAPKLAALVAAFHAEQGIDSDDDARRAAIAPLLEGSPYGCIWLIGPRKAPVGYIAVTFSWSLEFGGLDALIDELYIRPAVRGRNMGSDAVLSVIKALRSSEVRALHLEADSGNETLVRFYQRLGFVGRDRYMFMSQVL